MYLKLGIEHYNTYKSYWKSKTGTVACKVKLLDGNRFETVDKFDVVSIFETHESGIMIPDVSTFILGSQQTSL